MAGFEWKQERPFKAVYFTGMVRDKQRRKMSKQLGNSPDALKLIEDFGADGVRFGMLSSSPAGGDLLFDEKFCEQGRNFCNKLWNALRLVKGWEVEEGYHSEVERLSVEWFEAKTSIVLAEIEDNFKQYRLSEALMGLYNFIWDDFCSWYLEMIKPEYQKPIDRVTLEKTEVIFRKLMAMLHPFMPFITEEIWQQLDGKNREGSDLCVGKYPKAAEFDAELVGKVEAAKDIISKIREVRNNKGLKQREPLEVKFQGSETAKNLLNTEGVRSLIKKLGVLESLQTTDSDVENAVSFVSGTDKFYVVLNQTINVEEEREKMLKELEHQQGFLKSVEAKLNNERFVANAKPEVVAVEQKKQADALARIKILAESLAGLNVSETKNTEGAEADITGNFKIGEPSKEVLQLLESLESDQIEKTESTTDVDKFSEAICAFSNDFPNNKKAGYLLIGVKDNGQLSGLEATDNLLKNIAQIRHNGQILPQPAMSIRVEKFEKGDVIIVTVEPSHLPPVRYKGKIWIRTGPSKAVANETEERRLTEKRTTNLRTFDVLPCLEATFQELNIELFKLSYLPTAIDEETLLINNREIKQQLASLRLYDLKYNCPTNAGVLLLHKDPVYHLPGAYIQYVRLSGENLTSEVLAEKRFRGYLRDVLKNVEDFIKYNIIVEKPIRVDSFKEHLYKSFPFWSLRELALNAIMHRDYESNAPVYIYEFSDRIEIHNPGGLYGDARPDNFPNTSDYRNPVLAEVLKNLGYINRFNYGIQRSQEELLQNGNSPAVFDISSQTKFVVKIFKNKMPI